MKKTKIKGTLTGVFALAFVVLTLASCLPKKAIKLLGDIVVDDLRNAYLVELDNWAAEYPDSVADSSFCGYFIYDINADSIPELWIMGGTCEADKKLAVYTFDLENALQIYEAPIPHVVLYQGEGYVVCLGMNGGEALKTELTAVHDSILVDTLYMGKVDADAGYEDPTEPQVMLIPYSDREPVEVLLANLDESVE